MQWLKANGGPLALVAFGIGITGRTSLLVGLLLVAVGATWFIAGHVHARRSPSSPTTVTVDELASSLADQLNVWGEALKRLPEKLTTPSAGLPPLKLPASADEGLASRTALKGEFVSRVLNSEFERLHALMGSRTELQMKALVQAEIGREVEFEGIVFSVNDHENLKPFGASVSVGFEFPEYSVHAFFAEVGPLISLSRGDRVVIRGVLDSLREGMFSLQRCELVRVGETPRTPSASA